MNRWTIALATTLSLLLTGTPQAGSKYACESSVEECLRMMAQKFDHRGWVGIEYDHSPETGNMVIEQVIPKGPAADAGFRKGDELVAVNGVPFATEDKAALKQATKSWAPGDTNVYTVLRGDEELEIEVTLGRIPRDVMAQWVGSHLIEHHLPAEP